MAGKLSAAEKYMRDVVAGRVIVSALVRAMISRHLRDLEDGSARGLVFDRKAAQHVIDFFATFLVHTQGDLDGQPMVLEPFVQVQLWILYGWKWKASGYRRFMYAYSEMGRGNIKSTIASGLCVYELIAFGEPGAQVYSAATDKKTAKLVFDTAVLMIERNQFLRERVTIHQNNVHIPGTACKFEPCASEDTNLLGLRPHFIVLDELHEHASAGVWDVFTSAMGKLRQPLLYAITNSGYDRNSICWRQREYSVKVLTGVIEDDTWFAWICGLDPGDDWEDEANWAKANPSLGTIVKLSFLRSQAKKAKEDPASLNTFLRYHLSVWTSSHAAWMPMHLWDACKVPVDRAKLKGRACFAGMDLSTTTDISAVVLLFPPVPDDDFWYVVPEFFLPEENIVDRVKRDRVPYDVWSRQGLFNLTKPGRVIDYRVIRARLNALSRDFSIKEVVYDRWNALSIVKDLEDDGFLMVEWGQGFASMNAPTKRLMELVLEGSLAHGGNPALRWMASNVMVRMDPAGNLKMDKSESKEKIDGMVALGMALGRAQLVGNQIKRSVYEERGVRIL